MHASVAPEPFPTSCPENWQIIRCDFEPRSIWNSKTVTLVKKTATRVVFKSDGFYIKAFRTGFLLRYIRDPAKKEFMLAKRLDFRALTAPPVAWGSCSDWSYVATREIDGADLQTFLNTEWPLLSSIEQARICRTFAEFLENLAASGFFQPDFHLNNILFYKEHCRFMIIDLHRAQIHTHPLTSRAMIRQLSWCLPPFMDIITDRQILQCVSFLKKTIPELAGKKTRFSILDDSFRKMRRHWAKKNTRKLEKVQFSKKDKGDILITSRGCPEDALNQLRLFSGKPEHILEHCHIIKNSRHTLCAMLSCKSGNYFLKAYRSSGPLKALSYLLRKPKVLKQWETAWLMRLRHIPVAPPCAALQKPNPWSSFYGALLVPWSEDAAKESTKKILRTALGTKKSRGIILRNLAQELWKIHQKGIFHGDCKITNFVLHPSGKLKEIFDLDSVRIKTEIRDRHRITDIVCMCTSLEKLSGESGKPGDISKKLLSFYIDAHYPWQAKQDMLTTTLLDKVERKIHKSRSRKAHFRETLP